MSLQAINAAPGAVLAALTPSPCADLPSGARILLVDGDDTVEGGLCLRVRMCVWGGGFVGVWVNVCGRVGRWCVCVVWMGGRMPTLKQ